MPYLSAYARLMAMTGEIIEPPSKPQLSQVEKLSSVVRRCVAAPDSVRPRGEYFVALEPNSFGLPAVSSCPGRTDYCEQDCYALESEKRTATAIKLQRNYDALQAAGSAEAMGVLLTNMMSEYRQRAEKLSIPAQKQRFRIHWSGDFFSAAYASAWRQAIEANPDVRFYTYTRSFRPEMNVVPELVGLPNLDLFLSIDSQNAAAAAPVVAEHPQIRAAYLVDYAEEAQALQQAIGRTDGYRQRTCPENMRHPDGRRKLPVISARGGACSVCTYCIDKPDSWDVVFVKTGKTFKAQLELPFSNDVPVSIGRRSGRSTEKTAVMGDFSEAQNSTENSIGKLALDNVQSSFFVA